jgi:trehalose 6-phosphate phosphatase
MDDRNWSLHRERLLRLINEPRFGIISDFDGTLSTFADLPGQAAIVPEIAALIDQLADRVVVFALVSGRGVADLRQRFERPWVVYYGNHGIEYWSEGTALNALQAQPWVEPLRTLLDSIGELGIEGAFVEDKGITAAVHYRLTKDPAQARETLRARLQPLCDRYGFELHEGQSIFEIKPPVQLNKGTAAQTIIDEHDLRSVLFMGDDITDIHAMQRLRALNADPNSALMALSVGVVYPASPPALYESCDLTANGVEDVEALLQWLHENRTAPLPASEEA